MPRTGRPLAAGTPRTERIHVLASEAERAELEAAARAADMPLGEYLRETGLQRARQ